MLLGAKDLAQPHSAAAGPCPGGGALNPALASAPPQSCVVHMLDAPDCAHAAWVWGGAAYREALAPTPGTKMEGSWGSCIRRLGNPCQLLAQPWCTS